MRMGWLQTGQSTVLPMNGATDERLVGLKMLLAVRARKFHGMAPSVAAGMSTRIGPLPGLGWATNCFGSAMSFPSRLRPLFLGKPEKPFRAKQKPLRWFSWEALVGPVSGISGEARVCAPRNQRPKRKIDQISQDAWICGCKPFVCR